jgi:hypothetical protein
MRVERRRRIAYTDREALEVTRGSPARVGDWM